MSRPIDELLRDLGHIADTCSDMAASYKRPAYRDLSAAALWDSAHDAIASALRKVEQAKTAHEA